MQALQIEDIRSFMSILLTGTAFHHFETVEADLTTFASFHVDGLLQHSYLDSDSQAEANIAKPGTDAHTQAPNGQPGTNARAQALSGQLGTNARAQAPNGQPGMAATSRYITWQMLQPHMYELIRGKKAPLAFRLVLRLSDENTARVLASSGLSFSVSDVAGLYLNISFEKGRAFCITGTSLRVFTIDKSLEHTWDELVQRLLHKEKIPFTVL